MSRSSAYGQSYAMKHLQAGHYDEALAAADAAITRDPDDAEAHLERAQVLSALERHDETVTEILRAKALDPDDTLLDDGVVDDALFGALLAAARALAPADPEAAVRRLAEYRAHAPSGAHARDVDDWTARFRGKERTSWTRT